MDKEVLRQSGWKIPPDELPENEGDVEVLTITTAQWTDRYSDYSKWWMTTEHNRILGWRYKTSTPVEALVVVVNGEEMDLVEYDMAQADLSYDDIVILADYVYRDDYSITYRKGLDFQREGILAKGQSVPVAHGMVFNIAYTGNS